MDNNTNISTTSNTVTEETLKEGAKKFEQFWLLPKRMMNQEATLQLELTKNWTGWKLKEELVESLKLPIGETMNTEVKVLCGPGLMDETDDTDMFAGGEEAMWLLDHNVAAGSIINATVKFAYTKAPVGGAGKEIWKVSLIFVKCIEIVRERTDVSEKQDQSSAFDALRRLLG